MITVVTLPMAVDLAGSIEAHLREADLKCIRYVTNSMAIVAPSPEIDIVLSIGVPITGPDMERLPNLRAILSPVLGYDWIDIDAATDRGIAVANGEVEENRDGMVESTIMLLLALLYKLRETEALLRNHIWSDGLKRSTLKGLTVGVIGFGGIARGVINRLQGWGCHFLVTSRSFPEAIPGVEFVSLDHLLENADAILVLTALNASTRHMLGAAEFAMMRSGVLLVNTARGAIIDERALVDALRSGHVAAAALDVFEQEPLPAEHPLYDLTNVILTPHAIGHNENANRAVPRVAADNLRLLAEGRLPDSCRNPHAVDISAPGWQALP